MTPDHEHRAVDSALNGDEPADASDAPQRPEPNGSEDMSTATEAPEAPEAQAPPEAEGPPEPEAASDPAEQLSEPAPDVAETPEPDAVEEPSGIAADIERALQAAAEPEPEPEPDPEAVAQAETAEPAVEPPAEVPVVEAPAAEMVAAEPGPDGADTEAEDEVVLRAFQPGDWFVVHTYAGYENKVKTNLESRISSMNVEEKIFEVVIPMEDVMEIKSGKKQVVQRKVFPGYLLVRMDLDDDSWYVVRNTPGVTGFVGSGARPIPLSEREVDRILQRKPVGERPKPKLEWSINDPVRVTTGPFANFQGLISEIDSDRSKLKVLVNIFGRETPVELGFDQVAKV